MGSVPGSLGLSKAGQREVLGLLEGTRAPEPPTQGPHTHTESLGKFFLWRLHWRLE